MESCFGLVQARLARGGGPPATPPRLTPLVLTAGGWSSSSRSRALRCLASRRLQSFARIDRLPVSRSLDLRLIPAPGCRVRRRRDIDRSKQCRRLRRVAAHPVLHHLRRPPSDCRAAASLLWLPRVFPTLT